MTPTKQMGVMTKQISLLSENLRRLDNMELKKRENKLLDSNEQHEHNKRWTGYQVFRKGGSTSCSTSDTRHIFSKCQVVTL